MQTPSSPSSHPKSTILVTGGAGYIGSILVPKLLELGHAVRVVDRFYFGDSLGAAQARFGDRLALLRGDVRRLDGRVFEGVDGVIDLAGISNDPSCELDPSLTREVNYEGAVATMRRAREAGVGRFVLASSCSVYGRGEGIGLTESSPLNPVSLYARCKADAEEALRSLRRPGFAATILRLATVFGLSPRMRFDLAINVMTKNAYTRGQITVDGGGKQWRPFVHVADVAETMIRVLGEPLDRVDGEVFNVGHDDANVRILNLAYRVRDAIPGTQIVMAPTDPDLRNYNVRFEKLWGLIEGAHFRTIEHGIEEVLGALRSGRVDPDDRRWYTLSQYRFLLEVERTYRDLAMEGRVLS
jgi:nucleoside-diphosphate-sugar epimerase